MYESVEKNKGKIIVNTDDEILLANLPKSISTVSYGTSGDAKVSGELTNLSPFVEMTWQTENYSSPILHTQMVGKYNFYNYLAAAAFGVEFGVEPEKISEAIQEYTPTNNRSQVKKTNSNTLILDCYNANPTSMKSALDSFAIIDTKNKYFIIGDMKELGSDSKVEHAKIIELVESLNLQGFTVGSEFAQFNSQSVILNFPNNKAIKNHLLESPIKDSLILLKGSRSIGLEILEDVL